MSHATSSILHLTNESSFLWHDSANKCLESTLRVFINLTHDNATWCNLLLSHELTLFVTVCLITRPLHNATFDLDTDEFTKKTSAEIDTDFDLERERRAYAFDRLCLALGLLTNLVQTDPGSKGLCRMISTSAHRLTTYIRTALNVYRCRIKPIM